MKVISNSCVTSCWPLRWPLCSAQSATLKTNYSSPKRRPHSSWSACILKRAKNSILVVSWDRSELGLKLAPAGDAELLIGGHDEPTVKSSKNPIINSKLLNAVQLFAHTSEMFIHSQESIHFHMISCKFWALILTEGSAIVCKWEMTPEFFWQIFLWEELNKRESEDQDGGINSHKNLLLSTQPRLLFHLLGWL